MSEEFQRLAGATIRVTDEVKQHGIYLVDDATGDVYFHILLKQPRYSEVSQVFPSQLTSLVDAKMPESVIQEINTPEHWKRTNPTAERK